MIKRLIGSLENTPLTFFTFAGAVSGIIFLRFFIESFSARTSTGFVASDSATMVHYGLFFLAALLVQVLVLAWLAREKVQKVLALATMSLPLILVAPTIDLLNGGGSMSYIIEPFSRLVGTFFTYFGPLTGHGATLGIRIELAIVFALAGVYVWVKTHSTVRTFFAMFLCYLVVFAMGAFPSVIAALAHSPASVTQMAEDLRRSLIARSYLHPSEPYEGIRLIEMYFNAFMAQSMFLITLIAGYFVMRKGLPDLTRAITKNIRPERLIHYVGLAVLGFLLAAHTFAVAWTIYDVITVLTALACIKLIWIFAVSANDLGDVDIDSISNTSRPLIAGTVSKAHMTQVAVGAFLLLVLGGLSLGSYSLFYLLIFVAIVVVYSFPPLRLRRFPVVAHVLIAFACLCIALLGFFLASPVRQLSAFPGNVAILIVLVFTLGLSIKDIKDEEGDRAAGVRTLPTMLGKKWAGRVIGALLFICALLFPVLLNQPALWIPAAVLGAVLGIGVALGRTEKFVFAVYFLAMALLAMLLLFT